MDLLKAMQVFAVSSPVGDKDSLASLKVKASGEVTGFSPMTRCAPTLGVWGMVSRWLNHGSDYHKTQF